MRTKFEYFQLKIAGIHFIITADEGISLHISPRHQAFRSEREYAGYTREEPIRLFYGSYYPEPDHSPDRIWEAREGDYYWKVFDYIGETVVYLYYPNEKNPVVISLNPRRLDKPILVNHPGKCIEVLKYPMDIILLQFYSIRAELMMVHACGFKIRNNGILCLGRSGSGKTTLGKLVNENGGELIHDDRIFIRHTDSGWIMYPVPVTQSDRPSSSKINKILTLKHGTTNRLIPIQDQEKANRFLRHLVHFPMWRNNYIFQMILIEHMLNDLSFHQYSFLPNPAAAIHLKNAFNKNSNNKKGSSKQLFANHENERDQHDTPDIS